MTQLLTPRELELKILGMVEHARDRYDISEDCDGAVACARLGLGVRYAPLKPGTDGALINGQVVINQTISWPPRIEFTIFHEIFHYLLARL